MMQKERAEEAFKKRKALLEEKGVSGKEVYKDTLMRKLKADLKKAKKRLTAIDTRDARAEKPVEKTTEKPSAAEVQAEAGEKPKKKKAASEQEKPKKAPKKAKES